MAGSVLNSPRAIEMSVYVVRSFLQLREVLASNQELAKRLDDFEARIQKMLRVYRLDRQNWELQLRLRCANLVQMSLHATAHR
jgi:hypothetical protein